MSQSRKLLLIINPVAGRRNAKAYEGEITAAFCDAGYDVTVHETTGRLDAANVTRESGGEYDLVVCCGGDGTLSETIHGLLTGCHTTPIGYIPAGTTNDFAATMGIALTIPEAVQEIISGSPTELDIGRFGADTHFSYIASFGAFTKSAYSTPQPMKNALGHLAYLLEGAKEISAIEQYQLRILSGCTEYCGKYIFGAVSNSTSVGGLLKYSPDSVGLCDGLFEVLFIKAPENVMELGETLHCLTWRDFSNKNLLFFRTDKLEITCDSDKPLCWTTDGEYAGERRSVTICNLHSAVRIIK